MWLFDWLTKGQGNGVDALARRLGISEDELCRIEPVYHAFTIPKRSGGVRRILAPSGELKRFQRRILRRLLARLAVHPAAMGFERGRSIVTNARAHQGQAVVLRFDMVNFFSSTSAQRLRRYFRAIGWNRPAAQLLLRLCSYEDGLPQGAPTSPRLSNLVNYRLDARLAGMVGGLGGVYTRYADDITISFPEADRDPTIGRPLRDPFIKERVKLAGSSRTRTDIGYISRFVRKVVEAEGYRIHWRKKLSVRRRHQRQLVTGLVVNERVQLPREKRRWLRAVEHRARLAEDQSLASCEPLSDRKSSTLTQAQLDGWRAFSAMVERQSDG